MNITGSNPIEIMNSISEVTNGLLFPTLLIIIWLILFMRARDEPVREAMGGSLFIVSILGLLMSIAGLIGDRIFSITFFCLAGGIALLINKPDK